MLSSIVSFVTGLFGSKIPAVATSLAEMVATAAEPALEKVLTDAGVDASKVSSIVASIFEVIEPLIDGKTTTTKAAA